LPSVALEKVNKQQQLYAEYGLPEKFATLSKEEIVEFFIHKVVLHTDDIPLLRENSNIDRVSI
jgi:hypothetical protein